MAGFSGPSNGHHPSNSAAPHIVTTKTFLGAGSDTTVELIADGMPGLRVWILQTSGVGLVTVTPQFMNANAALNQPEWQPLSVPYAIVSAIPSLNSFPLGSSRFRLSLSSTGAAVLRIRLTASIA